MKFYHEDQAFACYWADYRPVTLRPAQRLCRWRRHLTRAAGRWIGKRSGFSA